MRLVVCNIAIAFGIGVLLLPYVAFAAPQNFTELIDLFVEYIDIGIWILIPLAIVLYFYNISTNLFGVAGGDAKKRADLQKIIMWGLIILFVMVSIRGIIALLENTFLSGLLSGPEFGSGTCVFDEFGASICN